MANVDLGFSTASAAVLISIFVSVATASVLISIFVAAAAVLITVLVTYSREKEKM